MIRFVWRTDVHLSDKAPVSRTDNWSETVIGKLEQIGRVAEHVQAKAVLDGGDFFHIKSPSRTPHALIQKVARVHAGYPCPTYCTPGNHDSVYGDYSYLHQQPLGVLYSTGVFGRLYDENEAIFREGDLTIRVVGIPYHGSRYDKARLSKIKKGKENWLVCVAHVLSSPKGGTMFEGEDIWGYQELAEYDPDCMLLGHWHKDQGVQVVNGKHFVNIGSLTRGSLTQDDIKRKPACAVLSFTRGEIKVQVVRLNVAPPEEVFDLDGRVRQEAREMTMDSFVESIRERLVLDQEKDLGEVISRMELPEQVRERALLYWENSA